MPAIPLPFYHAGVLEKLKAVCLDWTFWGDSYTHVQPPRPMCLAAPSCVEAELACSCRTFAAGHENDLIGSWLNTDQPDQWLTQTAERGSDEVSIAGV